MRKKRFNYKTGKFEKIPWSKKEKEEIVIAWLLIFFPVGLILMLILKPWDPLKYVGMKETSNKWCEILKINPKHILDADGWDKVNFDYSFYEEKISKAKFMRRLEESFIDHSSWLPFSGSNKSDYPNSEPLWWNQRRK